MPELSDIARREVEPSYVNRRNGLWNDAELRGVFKPVDDLRDLIAKKRATLQTITEQHRQGHIADDQVPRLRAAVFREIKQAQDAAGAAARKQLEDLPGTLAMRAFTTPPRSVETSEAKQDILLKLDNAPDVRTAALAALDSAVQSGDALAVRLLASGWGADLFASRTEPELARSLRDEVRARAAQAQDVFPEDARADLVRLGRLPDVERAFAAGVQLADMERDALEHGDLGDEG